MITYFYGIIFFFSSHIYSSHQFQQQQAHHPQVAQIGHSHATMPNTPAFSYRPAAPQTTYFQQKTGAFVAVHASMTKSQYSEQTKKAGSSSSSVTAQGAIDLQQKTVDAHPAQVKMSAPMQQKKVETLEAMPDSLARLKRHSTKIREIQVAQNDFKGQFLSIEERLKKVEEGRLGTQESNKSFTNLEVQMAAMQQRMDEQEAQLAINARKIQELQSSTSPVSQNLQRQSSDSDSEDEDRALAPTAKGCCRRTAPCLFVTTAGVAIIAGIAKWVTPH